mmetsp:Transcript_9264/g.39285  ORF Transcript_9264/g.39285 Transcript_9264/m.39285 type:complete len:374 (+) Transcript_9264:771-1892(+)
MNPVYRPANSPVWCNPRSTKDAHLSVESFGEESAEEGERAKTRDPPPSSPPSSPRTFPAATIKSCANFTGAVSPLRRLASTPGTAPRLAAFSRCRAARVTCRARCSPCVARAAYLGSSQVSKVFLFFVFSGSSERTAANGAMEASGSSPLNRTSANRSCGVKATRCGVARKYPFETRSKASPTMTVNVERGPIFDPNVSASRHAPARSRRKRPGVSWCKNVKHSKSVCSAMPTARAREPRGEEGFCRFVARAVPARTSSRAASSTSRTPSARFASRLFCFAPRAKPSPGPKLSESSNPTSLPPTRFCTRSSRVPGYRMTRMEHALFSVKLARRRRLRAAAFAVSLFVARSPFVTNRARASAVSRSRATSSAAS